MLDTWIRKVYLTSMDTKKKLVTVKQALKRTNNNQAELGRVVGVSRSSVNEWVISGREYLPELRAYKYLEAFSK